MLFQNLLSIFIMIFKYELISTVIHETYFIIILRLYIDVIFQMLKILNYFIYK